MGKDEKKTVRAGIEKLLRERKGIYAEDFRNWLTATDLSLTAVKDIDSYYCSCLRAGQKSEEILKEIKTYAHLYGERGSFFPMLISEEDGDPLLSNDVDKQKIDDWYLAHNKNPYMTLVYRYTVISGFSETIRNAVLEAANGYFCGHKRLTKEDGTDPAENLLIKNLKEFSESEKPMQKFLWGDFKKRKRKSFLWKKWNAGIVLDLFSARQYTKKQAENCEQFVAGYLIDRPDWEEVLQGLLMEYGRDTEYTKIMCCSKDDLAEFLSGRVVSCRIRRDMQKDKLIDKWGNGTAYDRELVERIRDAARGTEVCITTPLLDMQFRENLGNVTVTFNLYEKTVVRPKGETGFLPDLLGERIPFGPDLPLDREEGRRPFGGNIEVDLPFGNDDDDLPFGNDANDLPFGNGAVDLPFGNEEDDLPENPPPAFYMDLPTYDPRGEEAALDRSIFGQGLKERISFFVTMDNHIFMEQQIGRTKKWIPLTMKKLIPFIKYPQVVDFFTRLAEANHTPFLKDVIGDMREFPAAFHVPISYDDAVACHSRKEFFEKIYKDAHVLRWNYNRHNMAISYLVIKSLHHVVLQDYGILQNTRDDILEHFYLSSFIRGRDIQRSAVIAFLKCFYLEKDRGCSDVAEDYITICMNNRQPVVLHYSVARMIEEHDHFSDNKDYLYYLKNTKQFSVPKDSRFIPLRKLLPKEFEWIKTRKRLIDESMEMHHCVWSYHEKIKKDFDAIYSYLDTEGRFDAKGNGEPKRYTIEFLCNKGEYIVNQVQTKYDRGGGGPLKAYIEKILKEKSKEKSEEKSNKKSNKKSDKKS